MLTAGAAALLAALGLVSPPAAGAATTSTPDAFTAIAQQQIAALQAVKAGRTAAESKVDSKLLVAEKGVAKQLNALQSGVPASGTVLVDIRASKVSPDLIAGLTKAGAGIRAMSDRYGSVRAEVPLSAVGAIAARSDVKRVEQADEAMTARELATPATSGKGTETKEQKADRIAGELQKAVSAKSQRSAAAAATLTSEGDRAHNADIARQQFGVTGVGVKACALSDGVDSLAASQAKGELPPNVDVIAGQEGDGDEGTAMLEIIHDLAPNAALGFASAFNSDASFADNIRKLRFESHCDVIVDDVIYFKESPFQDWIIAQAVNDVTADGALYFSSAGNEGNVADGTAGHWEGDFVDSGKSVGKFAGTAHNFAGAAGNQIYEPISNASSAGVPVTLHWSDPLGASANDYDLYLLNAAGAVVSFSQNVQDGTQDPYEILQTPAFGGTGLRLAVVKFSGAARYLSLSGAARAVLRLGGRPQGLQHPGRDGRPLGRAGRLQRRGHPGGPGVRPAPRAGRPGQPGRPVPRLVQRGEQGRAVHLRRPAPRVLRGRRHADHPGQRVLDRW